MLQVIVGERGIPARVLDAVVSDYFDTEQPRIDVSKSTRNPMVVMATISGYQTREQIVISALDDHIDNTPRNSVDNHIAQSCFNAEHIDNHIECYSGLDSCEVYDVSEEIYYGPYGEVLVWYVERAVD